jgi:thiol-disulfide isomerase/thioredoxin
MTRSWILSVGCIAFVLTGLARQSPAQSPQEESPLQIGDAAPPVKIAKWMTQAPPALPGEKDGEKHVFLVEFWATWCAPCIRGIPHLADLHTKYQKDGLVVISVSNESPATIQAFLDGKKSRMKVDMPYFVGSDDDMRTNSEWMAGISTIPHAFLVGRNGKVLWSGNPGGDQGTMDDVIKKALDDKYDVATAKLAAASARRHRELMEELTANYQMKDQQAIFKTLDAVIELRPTEAQGYLIRRHMLQEFGRAEEIAAWDRQTEAALKDSSEGLMDLVATEFDKPLADRDPSKMIRCATRARELTKGRDPDTLETLAMVYGQVGMIDAAIATQKKAIALASDGERDELERILAYYVAAKAAAGLVETQ